MITGKTSTPYACRPIPTVVLLNLADRGRDEFAPGSRLIHCNMCRQVLCASPDDPPRGRLFAVFLLHVSGCDQPFERDQTAEASLGKTFADADDFAIREMLTDVLRASGYELTCCADGAALPCGGAIETAPAILRDEQIPGKSDLDTLTVPRAEDHAAPIFVMSGSGDISKPVDAIRSRALQSSRRRCGAARSSCVSTGYLDPSRGSGPKLQRAGPRNCTFLGTSREPRRVTR